MDIKSPNYLQHLLEDDDEEVKPPEPRPTPQKDVEVATATPREPAPKKGRQKFTVLQEKGEGLYRCGNCQLFNTPWRQALDAPRSRIGPRKACKDFGVKTDSRPCSFARLDPLARFNPINFGDIGIPKGMSFSDIQLTKLLLRRREDELAIEASVPFKVSEKVQFIWKNKFTTGTVVSYTRNYVYVQTLDLEGKPIEVPVPVGAISKIA